MATQGANNGSTDTGKKSECPWYWIVGIAALGAAMLMGFPLGALHITQDTCCFFELDSLSSLLTFWGAVFAGFLALFGLLISGVFVITAFKVERQAKLEARDVARKTVEEIAEKETKEAAEKAAKKIAKEVAEGIAEEVAPIIAEEIAEEIAKTVAPIKAEKVAEEIAKTVAPIKAAEVAAKEAKKVASEKAVDVAEKTAKEAVEKKDVGKIVQKEIDGITKEKVRQEIEVATRKELREQLEKTLDEYPFGRTLRLLVAKMLGTEKEKDRPPPKPPAGKKSDKDDQGPGR